MRRLLSFSFGDKLRFKWEELTDTGIDAYQLTGTEPPAPELQEMYNRFVLLFHSILPSTNNLETVSRLLSIGKIQLKYEDNGAGGFNRFVSMTTSLYVGAASSKAVIALPFIIEAYDDGQLLPEGKLTDLINDLEVECWKYIDGNRAQMRFDFEAAEEAHKEAK